jgi:hypothetical protein
MTFFLFFFFFFLLLFFMDGPTCMAGRIGVCWTELDHESALMEFGLVTHHW